MTLRDPSESRQLLVVPSLARLPGFVRALQSGWSSETGREADGAREQLAAVESDPEAFVRSLDDRNASGAPIALPDGSFAARLPAFQRWIWDGAFAGTIGFRWQPGTADLPATCLGHIGYSVVPWKRGLGYATRALGEMLPEAAARGLPYVELCVDPGNVPSQRVIVKNGGELFERFRKPDAHGGAEALRYRIRLVGPPSRSLAHRGSL